MIIKDELYGTIKLSDLEAELVDTAIFQRLRRIKQMAFSYLVYPGATHTRFEHSLGTLHLTSIITERLGLEKDDMEKSRIYALLHDIGHPTFSHDGEEILRKYTGDHEEVGKKMVEQGEISDILKKNFNPKEITGLGKKPLGALISSDLGADRMDYLKRDAQNTGVAYGVIDADRIIQTLVLEDNRFFIEEGGLIAAESLLIARFLMFSAVYLHKTARIAVSMVHRAMSLAIESGEIKPERFFEMGDEEALLRMRSISGAEHYADAILLRRLYKEALSIDIGSAANKKKIESELSERCGCDSIIAIPSPIFKPISFSIKTQGGFVPIEKKSALVSMLKKTEESRKRAMIICARENVDKVRTEAKKMGLIG